MSNDTTSTESPAPEAPITFETFTSTHDVAEGNLGRLHSEIEKINKRCRRMGLPEITITEGAEHFEDVTRKDEVFTVRFVTVTITGQTPRIAGWEFAATITSLDGINVLSVAPSFEGSIPVKYRTAGNDCDHCGYTRTRTETFVLKGADRWVQVGRQCLKDFLGYNNPHKVADHCAMMAAIQSLLDECSGSGGFGGGGEPWFTLAGHKSTVLALTAMFIRTKGWMSRGKAREINEKNYDDERKKTVVATADRVGWVLSPADTYEAKREAEDHIKSVTDEDLAQAEAALDWAQNIPEDTTEDYLHNIRALAIKGATNHKFMGFAASIVAAYRRAMGLNKPRTEKQTSEHFGTVGKREVFSLTVKKIIAHESQFGTTWIHIFEMGGNTAVWFASNANILKPAGEREWPLEALEEGKTYTLKATVKEHGIRNGEKQTVLSRVAQDLPKAPKAKKAKAPKAEPAPQADPADPTKDEINF